jgi:hypothetical protein
VCHDTCAWYDLICTNVGDDDGTIRADAQLRSVRVTNTDPLIEAERGLQPRYRRSYIRIDEHRSDSGGWRRTIPQHGRGLSLGCLHARAFQLPQRSGISERSNPCRRDW